MFKHYQLRNYKLNLVFLTAAISIFGIIVIGSAKQSVQSTQIAGLILSLVLMVVISLIDYSWILQFYWIIYGLAILLLIAVKLFGDSSLGAQRWINIGGIIRFQPSELCKILLILFFARFFMEIRNELNTLKYLVLSVLLILIPLFLVLKQPDLSTSIIIGLIFVSMIFMAGLNRKIVYVLLAVSVPAIIVFMMIVVQPDQKLISSY